MKTILKSFLCVVLCAIAKEVLACCGGPLEGTNGIILRVEGLNTLEDTNKIASVLKQAPGVPVAFTYYSSPCKFFTGIALGFFFWVMVMLKQNVTFIVFRSSVFSGKTCYAI